MIGFLGKIFGYLMGVCYRIIGGYGSGIILFTVLAKLIQLPISIMVQYNSIKMVKMYPEMNLIKAKFFGSSDLISEENYKLYKKHDYHPMYDLIPVIVQLIILMGVVEGLKAFTAQNAINTVWCSLDLGLIPSKAGGLTILIPIIAALSAWLMCFTQNKSNVLQSEQGKANKIITMSISVGLSLYLGFFVQGGVGLYWIIGNILAIIQMYALNFFINPKKFIDYEALEASKKELEKVQNTVSSQKKSLSKEEIEREKKDCRRFERYGTKQLVFYSENNGFYKYFKDIIEYILARTDITVHYITGDLNDKVFELTTDNFRTYFISENRLIMVMMKMDADMVVMTMPDLQKYHIKRSIIRNDIEYIYMDHGINSLNLVLRKHAVDYFDTIFAANDLVYDEIRKQEEVYGLKEKNIVKYGYCLIDNMIEAYSNQEKVKNLKPVILIAPSWQPDNILDSCIGDILNSLLTGKYRVIVRPHPQYVRHCMDRLNDLNEKYSSFEDFELQTDFSSNSTVFNADILMTDWSGIAYEYSFTTLKPTFFVNTPMKIMNPDYKEIDVVPFDIEIRDQIGISIEPEESKKAAEIVERLLTENAFKPEAMKAIREKYLYNVGTSAQVGAKYMIRRLIEISKR